MHCELCLLHLTLQLLCCLANNNALFKDNRLKYFFLDSLLHMTFISEVLFKLADKYLKVIEGI